MQSSIIADKEESSECGCDGEEGSNEDHGQTISAAFDDSY